MGRRELLSGYLVLGILLITAACSEKDIHNYETPEVPVQNEFTMRKVQNGQLFDVVIIEDEVYITNRRNKKTRKYLILE